jgi:dihydroorotate dehydrogenase
MRLLRFIIIGFLYKRLLKPIFFRFDPEDVHNHMVKVGIFCGRFRFTKWIIKNLFSYEHRALCLTVDGIKYQNPIGLAAGFDKDAELTEVLPSVGFGFEEVGSVTGEYCEGNPRPRLWRLPKSESLLVYYGLKNKGAVETNKNLSKKTFSFPVGISIAKTNCKATVETRAGVLDYKKAFETFIESDIGNYITLNISCPNAFGGEPFTDSLRLEQLLHELSSIPCTKPVYIKLPAELPREQIDEILKVVEKYKISGFICTNLAKKRDSKKIFDKTVPDMGGMSGKVVQDLSDELIACLYKKVGEKYTIIGCGGVFGPEDAYRKIKLGASLVQMITGMIYGGPQTIGEINHGLVKLLKKDGYKNISEAVGKE